MNRLVRIAAAAGALALAAPAAAAPEAPAEPRHRFERRFGLGVGLSEGSITPGAVVFVPLDLTPSLRVEPFVGIDRRDVEQNAVQVQSGTQTQLALGAGVFFVESLAETLQMYTGGRLGVIFESSEEADATPDERSRRDYLLAAVVGGELFAHPRLAVGAEGMLGYLWIGETNLDVFGGASIKGGGGSAIRTQGTIFLRVYLF